MPIALRRAVVVVVVVSAFAALAWVVTGAGLLLSNDGPAHLYAWYALAHIDDPKFAPFVVANPLLTYRGFATIFALADAALGWRNAFIACNVLVALAYAGGFLAVVIAARERSAQAAVTIPTARWPMGLLGIAFALQLPFYIGLLQYQLGTAFGLFAIAWWLRRRLSLVDHAVLAALLYAAAAVHTFAAVLGGLVCATITVFEVRSPRRLLGVVAAGTPAAVVFFLSLELAADLSSPSVWPSGAGTT